MSESEYKLQLSDISNFNNYPSWVMYRQKARVMAIIIWALIIYIFALWIYRSIIYYEQYKESSYYLLSVDAILVMVYVWFVMPYHNFSNNKFTGIKEMQRQMKIEQDNIEIDEIIDKQALEKELQETCDCSDTKFKLQYESFTQQASQQNQLIEQLRSDNKDLSEQLMETKQELSKCMS